jgi:hypothetical protein
MNRKNNALIPMENRESVTLHGKLHTVLMTLLENPYTAFFVETMPLCVQLNLIALLRLTIVNVFYIETWKIAAILSDFLVTTLIYSTSVAIKLRFLLPTTFQKIVAVIALSSGFITHMAQVLLAPNIQTSITDEFLSTSLPMLLHYLVIGAFAALLRMLWEKPGSFLHRYIDEERCKK